MTRQRMRPITLTCIAFRFILHPTHKCEISVEESTSDKKHTIVTPLDQKRTFGLSLRLNIVYFCIRGTFAVTDKIHSIKMRSV